MRSIPSALACAFVAVAAFSASVASASEILPPGVVGCINLKSAQQYASYSATSPNFAKDMLARATCYVNKDQAEVIRLSESAGFVQYKLLTGHRIWVPASAGTTPMPLKPGKQG